MSNYRKEERERAGLAARTGLREMADSRCPPCRAGDWSFPASSTHPPSRRWLRITPLQKTRGILDSKGRCATRA